MGRERYGTVALDRHTELLAELKSLLEECEDLVTGAPITAEFRETSAPPFEIGPTEPDLYVVWNQLTTGLSHPELGTIGPIPFRRTGGHTGPLGFLYCANCGLDFGDKGRASSFDVLPTIAAFLGQGVDASEISGRSLLPDLASS